MARAKARVVAPRAPVPGGARRHSVRAVADGRHPVARAQLLRQDSLAAVAQPAHGPPCTGRPAEHWAALDSTSLTATKRRRNQADLQPSQSVASSSIAHPPLHTKVAAGSHLFSGATKQRWRLLSVLYQCRPVFALSEQVQSVTLLCASLFPAFFYEAAPYPPLKGKSRCSPCVCPFSL